MARPKLPALKPGLVTMPSITSVEAWQLEVAGMGPLVFRELAAPLALRVKASELGIGLGHQR